MSQTRIVFLIAAASLIVAAKVGAAGPADTGRAGLTGTVKSAAGKPLEGVVVSAKQKGKTITTSVFTDDNGKYVFPPLEAGRYRVWAQAVGFETARAELDAAGKSRQDFMLKTLNDFSRQVSGSEWIASLPTDTPENRRMKEIFRNNCAGCHEPNYVLQNRFDEAGWTKMIDVMERIGIYGDPPRIDAAPMPLVRLFKPELAAYLAKLRGPGPSPIKFKLYPRPRGEAAQAVITEYDVTSNSNTDEYVTQDGSDWMEGVPSAYEARGPHDAQVDSRGFVWIVDSQANKVRTAARLDPNTGEVKNYRFDGQRGLARRSHGIVVDRDIAWFNADGALGKIDTKTDKMELFEPPKGLDRVGGTLDADLEGNVWASAGEGCIRFDVKTQKFTEFRSITKGEEGRTYGMAVDADGNCWWDEMNYDKLGKSDLATGKTIEVTLQPRPGWDENVTARDKEIYKFTRSDWNSTAPWTQAPRRHSADKKANIIWVAAWWGDTLVKIDAKTNKVLAYYQYPAEGGFAGVYSTVVDRHGNVWMNLMDADRVAKFDPKTEKWTTYLLPSIGTETRFIAVDNFKDPVEVWTPYWRTNRMARIQFRTKEQIQAQAQ